jgi:L-threonylcarbamoyladenylate synthase
MRFETSILGASDDDLHLAVRALHAGLPVAMPTETVYGLAANALSAEAVARVFEAKGRPANDPLIVHVSPDMVPLRDPVSALQSLGVLATPLSKAVAQRLRVLTAAFWPGPLTLVVPRGEAVPDRVTSGMPTVAVRMPEHPVAQRLITLAERPLVAPSANRFGRISPTRAEAVMQELRGRIPHVVDGGPCRVGVESTVARVHQDGTVQLLRPGAVTADQLAAVLGTAPQPPPTDHDDDDAQVSPGLLASHYAPAAPVVLAPQLPAWTPAWWASLAERLPAGARLSWLCWTSHPDAEGTLAAHHAGPIHLEVLTPDGTSEQAAHRLFACLRALDGHAPDLIVAERCPDETGLGAAIRDRMQKSSAATPPLDPA